MPLNLVGWNVVLDSDNADELSVFYEKLLGRRRLVNSNKWRTWISMLRTWKKG